MVTIASLQQSLWKYSAQLYEQTGMQQACLTWQDEFNGAVNGVLFTSWCDAAGYAILSSDHQTGSRNSALQRVIMYSQAHHVEPLRAQRIALKTSTASMQSTPNAYQAALAAELEAERLQQSNIIQWALPYIMEQHQEQQIAQPKAQYASYMQYHIATMLTDDTLINRAQAHTKVIADIIQRAQIRV